MSYSAEPDKKTTVIRLPQSMYNTITVRARARLRSINNEMVVLLKKGLVSEKGEEKALKEAEELIGRVTGKRIKT